jgi:hypothetical protein
MTRRDFDPSTFDYVDGDQYNVNLGGGPCNSDICDCMGFCRYSYCKHVKSLAALQAHNQLPEALVEDDAAFRAARMADLQEQLDAEID